MPAAPLIDKAMILTLLDELAEYGMESHLVDITLARDGPVDLDLLAECKRVHHAYRPKSSSQAAEPGAPYEEASYRRSRIR